MSEDERLKRIILEGVDEESMFVCPDIQRTAARRYLKKYPDAQGEVAAEAKKLLGEEARLERV